MLIEEMPHPEVKAFKNYAFKAATDTRSANSIAEKFTGALTELESARDVELLVALFANDCEIGNPATSKKFRGIESARRF